jgi:hypothetical protein
MPVFAYIDPGAGSLVIQAVIAAVVSIPFLFRSAIRSTLQRLRGTSARVGETDQAQPDAD